MQNVVRSDGNDPKARTPGLSDFMGDRFFKGVFILAGLITAAQFLFRVLGSLLDLIGAPLHR